MVMEDLTNSMNVNSDRKWLSDGLKAVKLSFVQNMQDINTTTQYAPDMIYQHLGEEETFFGYDDLNVNIHHTEQTLYAYINVSYGGKFKGEKGLEADDIVDKLVHADVRANVLCAGKAEFQQKLEKQKDFKPYGDLVNKFEAKGKKFEVYKCTDRSEEFTLFLERIQTVAMFYIECCSLTDDDDKWVHYFIYEQRDSGEGDGRTYPVVAGYASLYQFYNYINKKRPRIAHMLVMPQYRNTGIGASFMESYLRDLRATPDVFDVTVEAPGDAFVLLRDYVDCVNCVGLPEFAPKKLKNGYTEEMRKAALDNFKITAIQARRVYEILRYKVTNKNDQTEYKAQRLDVKKRLYLPLRRSERDWKRLNLVLTPEELKQAACGAMEDDTKFTLLTQNYEKLMESYQKVIDRLEKYPTIF